jgi:hypothetical protein
LNESHRSISGSNEWEHNSELVAYSVLLPVIGGDVLDIIPIENDAIIAYLTDADVYAETNTTPHFCQGHSGRVTLSKYIRHTITIPSDCNYLYFTKRVGNINFLPSVFKQGLSNVIELEKQTDRMSAVDLASLFHYSRVIREDGIWYQNQSYKSVMVPVNGGDIVTIIPEDNIGVCFYAFLTSTDNALPSIVTYNPSTMISGLREFSYNLGLITK